MNYQFIREGLPDTYGILALQDKILEIAVYIDRLCRENNIEYWLMGGSALGAARHGGFIPWDDDMDIFMTPDSFEKFREVFEEKGDKEHFYLQQLCLTNGKISSAKVRMNNTAYIEKEIADWDMHQGIFVDIFILHNCPENPFSRFLQFAAAKYVITRGLGYRSAYEKGLRGFIIKLLTKLPDHFLINRALKRIYRYRGKQTKYCCHLLGKAFYKKGIYPKEYFNGTRPVAFEKATLSAPVKLEEYLSKRYGDYMAVPSPDEIRFTQHALKWSTREGFENLCGGINNFADERKLY